LERLVVAPWRWLGCRWPWSIRARRATRATASGQLAKTDALDALDAAVLAHFAAAIHPAPRPLPDAQSQALSALVGRRQQVVSMLTAEKNCVRQAGPAVRASPLWPSPLWRERDQLLRRVPGIGPTVSLTLLAHLARSPCSLTLLAHLARSPA
jgi:transposase